jgi:glycosyltransferase involved in cell wall biosynthesis
MLNTSDAQGGAAIATYRMHQGLKAIGIDSTLVVQSKRTDDYSVQGPRTRAQKLMALARPILDQLAIRRYRGRENQIFTPAMVPDSLASRVEEIDPDIVHVFWVATGFMRLETLKQFNRPVVWTLHDMWPFTGGCHYDGGCGRYRQSCGACPVLHSSNEDDVSARVWKRKKRAWTGVNITVVASSRWLAECARSSSLFRDCRIEVLPNGIDEKRYQPIDKSVARQAFGLPQEKKLILFSAFSATDDRRKGFQFLLPALQKMAQNGQGQKTELVIIGASEPKEPTDLGMKAHYIGRLHDDISQVLLYSAADVVVAPSVQENLSNTVMESLACGTPVVAFNIGGMPDMIRHEFNGYLVEPYSIDGLAEGIAWVLQKDDRHVQLSQNARQDAVRRYGMTEVAGRYQDLYMDILK